MSKSRQQRLRAIGLHALLIPLALIWVFPLWMMAVFATLPDHAIFSPNIVLWFGTSFFDNISNLQADTDFLRAMFVSIVVGIIYTILSVMLTAMAGWALVRYRFFGKSLVLAILLGTITLPYFVVVIPQFVMVARDFGLGNTWFALIGPPLFYSLGVLFMRQAFTMMPAELFDAARVEGVSEWRIFFRVALPLARPTMAALSIILFLREQVGGNVVRRRSFVGQRSSTWYRPEAEMHRLEQKGNTAVIFELQGSLFFGTTHRLYQTLEPELATTDYLILDMQRVQSVDVTAAHMLNQVRDVLSERNVPLLISSVRERLPNGRNLREFLELAGLSPDGEKVILMPTLEAAIEWVEDRLLGDVAKVDDSLPPLQLHEIALFNGSKPDTLTDLAGCMETRSCKAGETIYARGDVDNNLYLIRSGEVRIMGLVGGSNRLCHIATFGRGEFFGGLAFLDHRPRGNDAIVSKDCELYVLTQEEFNYLAEEHKRIAFVLVSQLARTLAVRLRHTDDELTMLQEN